MANEMLMIKWALQWLIVNSIVSQSTTSKGIVLLVDATQICKIINF